MTWGQLVVMLVAFKGFVHGTALPSGGEDKYDLAFKEFVAKYDRTYVSSNEEQMRFQIFKDNYKLIEAHNTTNHSYSLAVNEFADQAPAEFQTARLGLKQPPAGKLWAGLPHLGTHRYSGAKLPTSVDWSGHGAVTPLKNQGTCGSCWAFSTTGALEGAWQVATGKLVSLSEQQLVDCSKENEGCGGGSMDLAFKYLKENAACTEDSYAYKAKAGTCRASNCTVGIPSGSVAGYKDVPADDMNALMEAVSHQPVSVGIEADQLAFQLYNGGILGQKCGDKLDHGVLLVGYGSENGADYWKVKNSWGGSWGEDGYIRLKRGLPLAGECGIKSAASYPVVHAGNTQSDRYRTAFNEFVIKYGRVFQSAEEEETRFNIFRSNYKFIESQNELNHSYVLAVNEFADQAPEEFQTERLGLMQPPADRLWAGLPHLGTHRYGGGKLPTSVDWTGQGAVTPLKNQASCGSCWAFSTTGALEGAWQIATGKLISLSEQQLVDCSKENHGCGGGSMDLAFKYLKNHAACTEDSYAYKGKGGACRASNCSVGIPSGTVSGYKDVSADDMKALMEAVSQQPVSVGIEADQKSFQLYKGGVLAQKCGDKLDHGVLLVGYGSENGVNYWKVKNSWGAAWGEDGYIRLKRGLPKAGECGIKSAASYPIIHSVQETVIVV